MRNLILLMLLQNMACKTTSAPDYNDMAQTYLPSKLFDSKSIRENTLVSYTSNGENPANSAQMLIPKPSPNTHAHLQIPHSFHDLHTADIGKLLCSGNFFESCMFNLYHRSHHDFTHTTNNIFNKFVKNLSATKSKFTIVQLHGFNAKTRKSEHISDTNLIISVNGRRPSNRIVRIINHSAMKSWKTTIYGHNINILGGTKNKQLELLRDKDKATFIHMELSLKLRRKLLTSSGERKKFLEFLRVLNDSV